MTLAGIATSRNTTVAAVCKQLGDSAIQTAAAFAGNGGMPPMPGMPPGMAMGAMPGMPALPPGLSTMPSMPGMPPTR